MNTNITRERAIEILSSFNNERNFKINLSKDIKSINFYEEFIRMSKNVW